MAENRVTGNIPGQGEVKCAESEQTGGCDNSKACKVLSDLSAPLEIPYAAGVGEQETDSQNKPTQSVMTLFETQDVNLSCEDETDHMDKPWGKLLSYNGSSVAFDLSDRDEYSFGRNNDCDYCFNQNAGIKNSEFFQTYSKIHFKIIKEAFKGDQFNVILEDKSSNGTFVNGEQIGKNKKCALHSDDIISLSAKMNKVFIFIDPNANEDVKLPSQLRSRYRLSRVLGKGACGEVRLALEKGSNKKYAVKVIGKRKFTARGVNQMNLSQAVRNEVNILKSLDHPCIINIEDVIDDAATVYIVLELIEGGELFDRVVENGAFAECDAKLLFYQMVHAIKYLHDKNISHRDLKPENVLLQSCQTTQTLVKITDFGLSKFVDEGQLMKTFCGTPNYLAPEVLSTQGSAAYTNAVDVWSLGVILFICLSGFPPFSDERKDLKLAQQILTGSYTFRHQCWRHVSSDAKELISKMLTVNPNDRITLSDALDHPWLKDAGVIEQAHRLMYTGEGSSVQDVRMETVGPAGPVTAAVDEVTSDVTTSCSSQDTNTDSTATTTTLLDAKQVAGVGARATRKRVVVDDGQSENGKQNKKRTTRAV